MYKPGYRQACTTCKYYQDVAQQVEQPQAGSMQVQSLPSWPITYGVADIHITYEVLECWLKIS